VRKGILFMPLFKFRSDFEKIPCPDGSIRLVLRSIEKIYKAFGVNLPSWSFKLNADLKSLKEIAEGKSIGNVSIEAKNTAGTILDQLDEVYQLSINNFAAAYIAYTTNPCENDKKLSQTVNSINREGDSLRHLEAVISELENVSGLEPTEQQSKLSDISRRAGDTLTAIHVRLSESERESSA
jgi:hypothetical protein